MTQTRIGSCVPAQRGSVYRAPVEVTLEDVDVPQAISTLIVLGLVTLGMVRNFFP